MFIFSLSIATWLRASKKEPSSAGDSCVTLSKPLYLSKSWLGPLQWGWHSFLLPHWLTDCCFCSHQDSSREGGEVTRWKVLTCSILSYKGPMPSGIKRCFKMTFYGFSRDPLPGYCTYKFVKGRASFIKPSSFLSAFGSKKTLNIWDPQDNIPAKGSTAGPWSLAPHLPIRRKGQ